MLAFELLFGHTVFIYISIYDLSSIGTRYSLDHSMKSCDSDIEKYERDRRICIRIRGRIISGYLRDFASRKLDFTTRQKHLEGQVETLTTSLSEATTKLQMYVVLYTIQISKVYFTFHTSTTPVASKVRYDDVLKRSTTTWHGYNCKKMV